MVWQHPSASGDPVMLWVDTFTDYFTPEVGIAAVNVLEHAGYSVRIPSQRLCCGLTLISTGQLDAARKVLNRSVTALADSARDGVPIVGLEPSCTAVFRSDAVELLGDGESVTAVSGSVRTLAELLGSTDGWEPPPWPASTRSSSRTVTSARCSVSKRISKSFGAPESCRGWWKAAVDWRATSALSAGTTTSASPSPDTT